MVDSTSNWVVCLRGSNEITWNQTRTLKEKKVNVKRSNLNAIVHANLVDKLIESMLAVGAGFTLRKL